MHVYAIYGDDWRMVYYCYTHILSGSVGFVHCWVTQTPRRHFLRGHASDRASSQPPSKPGARDANRLGSEVSMRSTWNTLQSFKSLLLNMATYSEFSHEELWLSTVMLCYVSLPEGTVTITSWNLFAGVCTGVFFKPHSPYIASVSFAVKSHSMDCRCFFCRWNLASTCCFNLT